MTITITEHVSAPIETTWLSYTDPAHIIHWNFASSDWCCPSAKNDLVVGGKYVARMEAKDGSMGFDFEATYSEINPFSHFSYQIADGRNVHVRFSETSSTSCQIEVEFEAENVNPADLQRVGWQSILTNFKRYTDALAKQTD